MSLTPNPDPTPPTKEKATFRRLRGEPLGPIRSCIAVFALAIPLFAIVFCVLTPWASPAFIITKMCSLVFGLIVCLWVLDASGILSFSERWMSYTIWTAGIAGIVGGGAKIYADTAHPPQTPLQGAWRATFSWALKDKDGTPQSPQSRKFNILIAATGDNEYRAISENDIYDPGPNQTDYTAQLTWLDIPRLSVRQRTIRVQYKVFYGSRAQPSTEISVDEELSIDIPFADPSPALLNANVTKDNGDTYKLILTRN